MGGISPIRCRKFLSVRAFEDGRRLDIANVIWCTGFGNGLSWIDLSLFEPDGEPRHESGIAAGEPGLYFVGLHFLHSFSSTMIHGIARDAERIRTSGYPTPATRILARTSPGPGSGSGSWITVITSGPP